MFEKIRISKAYEVYVGLPKRAGGGWYSLELLVLVFSLIAVLVSYESAFRPPPEYEDLEVFRGRLHDVVDVTGGAYILVEDIATGNIVAFPNKSSSFPIGNTDKLKTQLGEDVELYWRSSWFPAGFPRGWKRTWDGYIGGSRYVNFDTVSKSYRSHVGFHRKAISVSLLFLALVLVVPWIAHANHTSRKE